jgi:phospholipase/lecithinase/hemolysin
MTVVLALACFAPTLRAEPITGIVVFGDSLSDTGNVALAGIPTEPPRPSPPYYAGRFSNGPVWVERLASRLGLPLSPSLKGGTDYAYGGAETGQAGTSTVGTPNIGTQVSTYLSGHPKVGAGQLFVVWGGANDFLLAGQTNPAAVIGNLQAAIGALAAAGAKNFLVPNLPLLGELPETRGTPYQGPLDQLTAGFNAGLEQMLKGEEASQGIVIHRLDVAKLFGDALSHPGAYGLTNVTDPALNVATGQVVPDPGSYLFWDPIHPTEAGHRLIGDAAAAMVPEPASWALLLAGGAGLAALARRRGVPRRCHPDPVTRSEAIRSL